MYIPNYKDKMEKCKVFFQELAKALGDDYEVVGSCNEDSSVYLIPKGTSNQITYYGKPIGSFRISDHWNWYSNLVHCKRPWYVQCNSVDMPWARKRDKGNEQATKPVRGIQVAYYGKDKMYHHVYGDLFDRKTREWIWCATKPQDIVRQFVGQ